MSVFGDGSHSDVKTTYYKAANVKTDRPNFKKFVGKDKPDEEVDWIAGILYKIERSEFEYEGETNEKIAYFLSNEDGTETKKISCGWPALYNKDFLNRLANLDSISAIKMLLWSSQDEERNKSYTRGSIRNLSVDGKEDVVKYKYPSKEIPSKVPIKAGTKTVWDDVKQNEFFTTVLEEHVIPKLKFKSLSEVKASITGNSAPAKQEEKKEPVLKGEVHEHEPEFDEDGVPF
jgi:hypothetical protein